MNITSEIIKTVNLTKKFGDFTANDTINLTVRQGEIKAIVGENGAGKSTLMNMLYGLLKPTAGEIFIRGEPVHFHSPTDAIAKGIGMVHQHFKLVPSLTVFENVMLGIELNRHVKIGKKTISIPQIDHKREAAAVQKIIDDYKFGLKATDRVQDLSIGAKQKVEIIKMLYRQVDIIIFDEPTAVLTPQEIEMFFHTVRELKNRGSSIIIITHKLQEVMAISDSVTVIKHGKVVGNMLTKDTSDKQIARLMVGRDVLLRVEKKYQDFSNSPLLYEVKNLTTKNSENIHVVDHVSFNIHQGEIVGIAGVEGNGQSELLDLLSGVLVSTEGKVFYHGQDMTNQWPNILRKNKISFIPEDRYEQGLCADMQISENIIAGYHDDNSICKFGIISQKKTKEKMSRLVKEYDIRLSSDQGKISSLSGGNAQKVIIAREFDAHPELLIAAQPTRGVDIGAIEFIHQSLLNLQASGKSILLVSSELSEIMNLSDRILVMYKGKIIGERDAKNASREEIGYLMAGIKEIEP